MGTPGDDSFTGTGADDSFDGAGGNDTIDGRGGADTLSGGTGNDTIIGGGGNDAITGNDGDDTISGDGGADTIDGGTGQDSISGGNSSDSIDGGAGNDTLSGDDGNDTVSGGGGADWITGGFGADSLSGGAGNDTVQGNDGSDVLLGGAGNDSLNGGSERDTLDGGAGNDTLSGGNDLDRDDFIFREGGGDDVIVDFDPFWNDKVGFDHSEVSSWADLQPLMSDDGSGTLISFANGDSLYIQGYRSGNWNQNDFYYNAAPVCFVEGTMILTPSGEIPVDALSVGDLVTTAAGEHVPIRWIGAREMVFSAGRTKHRPIEIKAGALSEGRPTRNLAVSPQHCLQVNGPKVTRLFGVPQVFVRAKWLTALPGVRVMTGKKRTRYITFLLGRHQIIQSNGALAESFFPGPMAMKMLPIHQRKEIEKLLPRLREDPDGGYGPRAARVLTRAETVRLRAAAGQNLRLIEPKPSCLQKVFTLGGLETVDPR